MVSTNPRTLWLIRHAEREDNINPNWQANANPNGLKSDNSPLSERGRNQAMELAERFSTIQIDHIFASPFERTMETASILAGGQQRNIQVKPELGFLEPLFLCENPPGFEESLMLKCRFPLTDIGYDSIYGKPLAKERAKDFEWKKRVHKTVYKILYDQFKEAESIVLVSHGSTLGAIHEELAGKWVYIGQATVSKFVETPSGQFILEYAFDDSHLADKENLRGKR